MATKPQRKVREVDCCFEAVSKETGIRKGRADYRCPKCGKQIMLLMVFIQDALTPKEEVKEKQV